MLFFLYRGSCSVHDSINVVSSSKTLFALLHCNTKYCMMAPLCEVFSMAMRSVEKRTP